LPPLLPEKFTPILSNYCRFVTLENKQIIGNWRGYTRFLGRRFAKETRQFPVCLALSVQCPWRNIHYQDQRREIHMQYRLLGRTGWKVSTISFGAWAIGDAWGPVNDQESLAALSHAVDLGVNFFDTADVYGDGRSERLLAQLRRQRTEEIRIATKAGRRLDPHTADGYNRQNLTAFVERSLKNLDVEALDLLQLHCPPTEVYYRPEVFGVLDDLVKQGKLLFYGVSVEKVEEALKALEYPGVQSVQIIFNIFRQRPAELFFEQAQKKKVGILARVPLASGLLSGKMTRQTPFTADDHRFYNRHGESFDRGETFSGVDYEAGLQAVDALRPQVPSGMSMAQMALRWLLMYDAVTCAIPGAKRPAQVEENTAAADLSPIPPETMQAIRGIYEQNIRPLVHQYW
jgi:aryl-alcohol dehydrogenase-like predicted oxidoreductase